MYTNIRKVIKIMENIAPSHTAESWDNVGLLVGNENKMVENILVALEVTEEVINEAIEKNVDLIIVHHPLIYKPLKKITSNDPISNMVIKLIENNIALYAAHTNLDKSEVGTCAYIAELLELERTSYLTIDYKESLYKIQTFCPIKDTPNLKEKLTQAGAGQLGDYEACTFQTEGIGEFMPNAQANPYIGENNKLEQVEEIKIESIVTKDNLSKVINALIKNHPYEEPAYDIIKLENTTNEIGIGSLGYMKSLTLKELAKKTKEKLNANQIRVIGDLDKKVSKVAVVTGAGADYFKAAKQADVLITGDIKYHEAQTALQKNINVIDAGHFETENIYMPRLKQLLDQNFEEKAYDINVHISNTDINPFQLI